MKIASSILRFAIVGVAATIIHILVVVALVESMNWHPGFVNGIAFLVANLFSYTVHTRWSFERKMTLDTWYRFLQISFLAWLLTIAISWSVDATGGSYLVGILLVVTIIPAFTYIGHRNFTYR